MTSQKDDAIIRPDEKVEAAVRFLNTQKEAMESELTIRAKAIGDYLLQEFFAGNLDEVSSQNPAKNVSFKKLCERPDLPFSESALRRFIHVAVNFRVLPPEKAKELPPSHHSVLYSVADHRERCRIGCEAVEKGLSVRRLREAVKGKGRRRPGAGRKRTSDFYKNWKALVSTVETMADELVEDEFIEENRISEVKRGTRSVRDKLNKILDRLNDLANEKQD